MIRKAMPGALMILALAQSVPGQSTSPTLDLIGTTAIPPGSRFGGIAIGGLSGLDRMPGGDYLAISDDKGDGRPPRFYRLAIKLDPARHHMQVRVKRQVFLRDADGVLFPTDHSVIDPEGIRHARGGHVIWSSEGTWSTDPARRVQPAIFESNANGRILRRFTLPPAYLYADNRTRGAASNGVLEGLAVGLHGTVYAINEVPAYEDRATDDRPSQPAHHRLTSFDPKSGQPLHQYVYEVPDKRYSVSELMTVDDHRFLSIERIVPFDAKQGVRARIILSRIANDTTDVLGCSTLTSCPAIPMIREVLVDLPGHYRDVLIDNLEGMAWGPKLADGRRTLIVEADDNFNKEEMSQFIAFAWTD